MIPLGDFVAGDAPIVNIDWRQFSEGLIRDVHLAGRQALKGGIALRLLFEDFP